MSAPPGQGRRRLSDADLELLVELREGGKTYAQISAAFARRGVTISVSAISWQCLRRHAESPRPYPLWEGIKGPVTMVRGGHELRRFTEEEDHRLLELEARGLPLNRIATMMGRRNNSIRGRLMTLARREQRREEAA